MPDDGLMSSQLIKLELYEMKVTKAQLNTLLARLNTLCGLPVEPFKHDETGAVIRPLIKQDNFTLEYGNGYVSLCRRNGAGEANAGMP